MRKLSDQEIEQIASLLKEGKPLSEDYKTVLFDAKKEYELAYANKEREEDILSDTMAVPLQPVKTFRNGEDGSGWTNMLIFGDNLQVLKTLLLMKQEGKLKSADGTPGVRLVYIDPPFATRQEFQGSQNQKAYQDKIAGANFLEFLRKRLVFLRELLSEDGSIYVHLDWKKVHYIKVLMDEIFGEYNFITEIIWNYGSPSGGRVGGSKLVRSHETLIGYAKHYGKHVYNHLYLPYSEKYINDWFKYEDEQGRRYLKRQRGRDKDGNIIWEKQYLDDSKGMPASTVWYDIQQIYADPRAYKADQAGKSELTGYPTQKPEKLLNRLIQMSSNPGDIILDCFAGSGTTLAVAERLGRRWIGVDCGKLAIYTIQKRLLNIAESKNLGDPQKKKKYGKPCRPFTLYNAGLYDYQMLKNLPWELYREFALKLFQCRDEKHEISKIELDGYLGADGVLVFNYQKHKDVMLDRGFIDDLHRHLEERIGRRFFIIAPAASVRFLEDYIEKGSTKYFILRIPYSIIEEIHNRGFTKIKQPVSEMDINDTVDAVGFDFIQVPTVECKYFIDDKKGQQKLGEGTKECVIKIEKFESKVISRKPLEFANLETLSMVMLDYDFDGEVFDLDEVFYAEELKKNGYEVRFGKDKVKGQMMVIYMDIFGNERREIKTLSDFEGKRGK